MRELAICVATLTLLCSAARAQGPVEPARERFERGLAAFDAGELEAAEGWFRESLALRRSGSAAFNLGRVLERTGQLVEATELFREVAFLRGVPAEIVAQARANVQALEPRLASLVVRAPDDASLSARVDDRTVPLNAEVPVDPGRHRVRVRRGAREWIDVRVTLAEGERRTVDARVPPVVSVPQDDAIPADGGAGDTWLWVTLSVVAVLLIGAGIGIGVGLATQPGCGTLEPGCIMAGAPPP